MSPRQRRGTTRRSTCSDTTDHAARGPRARNPRTEVECGDPPKFRMTRADLSELGNRPSLAFEHASRLMENETEGELYFLERIPGSLFW